MSAKPYAFYGRLSTTDKQDPALSFPSQRKACEKQVAELGGKISRDFSDQESGSHDDRPGWSALTQEARDREGRSFDAVVIYSTSRLARDVYLASLYHRELGAVGVPIHYATGGGDADTPEGKIFLVIQQAFDQFERDKLSRETKRGMREASEQGFRAGGRAPYGYQRRLHDLDPDHLGDRDKSRVTLEAVPEEAEVVAKIFELFTAEKLSPKAIAERLNQPGGPPPPSHVDSARNVRGKWAGSTIRAMLRNPVYTGKIVWNRRDFATGRQNGGGSGAARDSIERRSRAVCSSWGAGARSPRSHASRTHAACRICRDGPTRPGRRIAARTWSRPTRSPTAPRMPERRSIASISTLSEQGGPRRSRPRPAAGVSWPTRVSTRPPSPRRSPSARRRPDRSSERGPSSCTAPDWPRTAASRTPFGCWVGRWRRSSGWGLSRGPSAPGMASSWRGGIRPRQGRA